jgi:hypothetical protein
MISKFLIVLKVIMRLQSSEDEVSQRGPMTTWPSRMLRCTGQGHCKTSDTFVWLRGNFTLHVKRLVASVHFRLVTAGRLWLVYCCNFFPFLSPCLYSYFGSWPLFSLLILYTVGRTSWTGDQPVARPLPTHRTT